MADVVSKEVRSRMMSGIKGKDTKPELLVRRSLHALGLRFRLGGAGLPGKPDLVFSSRNAAVFIHGCFWHRHKCKYFKWPKSNATFWLEKINANAARDAKVRRLLRKLGWRVFVIWECELKRSAFTLPNAAIDRLAEAISRGK